MGKAFLNMTQNTEIIINCIDQFYYLKFKKIHYKAGISNGQRQMLK